MLDQAIAELRRRNEPVSIPRRLPTPSEVEAMEVALGVRFPDDYRRFLLEASDVVLGTLVPATITNASDYTYLPAVVASARDYGGPAHLFPICEDNADFYCLASSGEIHFWSHNGATDERWPSLAHWLLQVWLGERS